MVSFRSGFAMVSFLQWFRNGFVSQWFRNGFVSQWFRFAKYSKPIKRTYVLQNSMEIVTRENLKDLLSKDAPKKISVHSRSPPSHDHFFCYS